MSVVLAILGILFLQHRRGVQVSGQHYQRNGGGLALQSLTIQELHGRDVYIQMPAHGEVEGVLFVAHGCSHSGGDFFVSSVACPDCLGLPEELAIAALASKHNMALVAVSSGNRASKCWDMHDDVTAVNNILNDITTERGWMDKPLYALGASSGGAFVLALPRVLKLAGLCPQIMAVSSAMLEGVIKGIEGDWEWPPTLFVHMQRDERTAKMVQENMEVLKKHGAVVEERILKPLPLHENFFSTRIPSMSAVESKEYYAALKNGGMLDDQGFMTKDPRHAGDLWRTLITEAAEKAGRKVPRLQADASDISEVLNVAWAGHELLSDYVAETMEFWGKHVGTDKGHNK